MSNEIHPVFNNMLQKIVTTPSNTIVIGPKNGNVTRIISAITSLFQINWNIVVVEDRTELNVVYGKTKSMIQPSSDKNDQLKSIADALNLPSDRLILNVGNYNLPISSLYYMVSCFQQKKGCIGICGYRSDIFRDMERDLIKYLRRDELFMNDLPTPETELIKTVDYVIKVGTREGSSDQITEIWGRDSNSKLSLIVELEQKREK